MSDWSWEYLPSRDDVLTGLPPNLEREVERIGDRLANAADVKYMGEPLTEDSGVSNLQSFAEGPWLVWYLEHRRWRKVLITRVANPTAGYV